MQTPDWKKFMPYLGAILIFVIISIGYMHPVLQGKKLMQSDIVKFEGMAKEIRDYRAETGEEALWTNSMFGGMPAFQISVIYGNNIARFFHKVLTLGLPRPADMVFLYFIGFFIFLLILKVNIWVALLGATGFALSSYHFIIIDAGHNSKALAIAYMAPVLASIIHTFRGKYLEGGILFSIFLALQLFSNHLQITYYLLIIVVFYGIFELVNQIREKKLPNFLKATGVLVIAAIIAVGVNIGNFWSTYVYTTETMRGGSELTIGEETTTSGLSVEYITNWSYGVAETFSLLIPNVKGGASGQIGANEKAMEVVEPTLRRNVGQGNQYWGDQPFTSGPVYVGVVVLFLFFMSLFFVKGALKWGLLLAAVLAIMLSWGRNFMPLTEFFIHYIPGYNKFRAVSMTLVVAELVIPALAFVGLHQLFTGQVKINIKHPAFLTALGLTAGISLLFYIAPGMFFSFMSTEEQSMFAGWMTQEAENSRAIEQIQRNLELARMAIFKAEAGRSIFFALATALVIWLFSANKIKKPVFLLLLGALILIDMLPVSKRYFDHDKFVSKRQVESPFQATQADRQILQDTDPHYRVYNVTVSSFNDSSTSWFHKSIGGYHGAKLQRYQELIDMHITKGNMDVLNMLNTRWLIVPGPDQQPAASFNDEALGNAWFVNDIQWVEDANEEIMELLEISPGQTALIDKRFEDMVTIDQPVADSTATIELLDYQPNKLTYRSKTSTPQLALFSEIYYPHGWEVYVNGEKADHFRANYVLRAMVVPAGENEIEFVFRPASYYTGNKIALFFSILLVIAIAGYGYRVYTQKTISA
jgi:hypothetical protein